MAKPNLKLRVFLCHASQDKPIVRELYHRLLSEGWIDPWLDEEDILGGQDYDIEIQKAVDATDVVIVCNSSRSVAKEGYIQKEIRRVLDKADEKPEGTIYIIPIRLDECDPPRRFGRLHYLDYFPEENKKDTIKKLIKSLRARARSLGVGTKITATKSIADDVKKVDQTNHVLFPYDATKKFVPPPYQKLPEPVCEICHKPFRFLEKYATCDICGARYHKGCRHKIMDIKMNYHCLRCGNSIESEKFRFESV